MQPITYATQEEKDAAIAQLEQVIAENTTALETAQAAEIVPVNSDTTNETGDTDTSGNSKKYTITDPEGIYFENKGLIPTGEVIELDSLDELTENLITAGRIQIVEGQ